MDDAAVFGVGDFGDSEFCVVGGDRAGVEDLAAAGGIEGGAVEDQGGPRSLVDFADFGVEVVEEGVVVVEAVVMGRDYFTTEDTEEHRGPVCGSDDMMSSDSVRADDAADLAGGWLLGCWLRGRGARGHMGV